MKCDTCKQESPVVMRVVVARGYNRSLARPLFNCPDCFEKKERDKAVQDSRSKVQGKAGGSIT